MVFRAHEEHQRPVAPWRTLIGSSPQIPVVVLYTKQLIFFLAEAPGKVASFQTAHLPTESLTTTNTTSPLISPDNF